MSRQSKVKAKPPASVDDEHRAAAPRERDSGGDDPATSFRPDPTTPGDYVGPPLHGKTNPREDMDDTVPTLDDEHRSYHHHPSENDAIEFEIDPQAGDAAADLAADLGSQFLEGATRGEDLSALALELGDDSEAPLDMLLDEGGREDEDEDEADDEADDEVEPADEAEALPPPPQSTSRRRPR